MTEVIKGITPDQQYNRNERIGLMEPLKGMEYMAVRYCDSKPEIYGILEEIGKQEGLFG